MAAQVDVVVLNCTLSHTHTHTNESTCQSFFKNEKGDSSFGLD